jgi:hypothetical protein
MIGEALGLAAFGGNDIHIGIAVVGSGESDPFAVWRKFGVELVAGAGGEAPRCAALARRRPQVSRVREDDFVAGDVRITEKARIA